LNYFRVGVPDDDNDGNDYDDGDPDDDNDGNGYDDGDPDDDNDGNDYDDGVPDDDNDGNDYDDAGKQPAASSVHYNTSCKHSLVLLRMGDIIARNMLS
jgi:hypothetical protein